MDRAALEEERIEGRDLGRTIFRNTVAASIGSWFTRIANFLFIIFAVRTLGEVELGRYATVVAFVGLFSVFSELGMAQYVERSIAQDHRRAQELFWNLVVLRAVLAVAGIAGISLLALGIYDEGLTLGIFIFSLTFLLSALLVPLTVVLTANERFDLSTAISLIGQLVTVGLGLTLLWAGLGIYALLLTGFVAMPLQIITAAWLVRRFQLGRLPFRIDLSGWRSFIRASLPFGVTSLALTLNFNVDTVILGFFRPDADVGWYNASYRLIFNAVSIVGAFLVVMTPSLAREQRLSPERVASWVRGSVYWMIVFAVPAGAGLSALAPDTVALLYGDDFDAAGPIVAIIAWDIPFVVLLSLFGNVTAAIGRERPAAAIYVGSAATNVLLNFAFIPLFGMYAAASITVLSDLITVGCFFVLLRDILPLRPRLTPALAQVGAATGLMVAALWLVPDLPLIPAIALGSAVYLGAAAVLRLFDVPATLSVLRVVLRRRRSERGVS